MEFLLYSHMALTGITVKCSQQLTRTFALPHTTPPDNSRRLSGVQFMSESSLSRYSSVVFSWKSCFTVWRHCEYNIHHKIHIPRVILSEVIIICGDEFQENVIFTFEDIWRESFLHLVPNSGSHVSKLYKSNISVSSTYKYQCSAGSTNSYFLWCLCKKHCQPAKSLVALTSDLCEAWNNSLSG